MRAFPILSVLGLASLPGLSGCVSQPATTTTAVSAYELGDRACYKMDELVVSLPLLNTTGAYQNLHLSLGVLINPARTGSSSDYAPQGVVDRLAPRMNAAVSAALIKLPPQLLADTPALRAKAIAEAETVLSAALRNWAHAADYKFEVTVLGIYWTDPSVGRVPVPASRW